MGVVWKEVLNQARFRWWSSETKNLSWWSAAALRIKIFRIKSCKHLNAQTSSCCSIMLLDDLLITYPDGSIRDAAEGLTAGLAWWSCVLWFSSTWLLGQNARTRLMLSRANIVDTNMCNHFSRCYQCLRVAAWLLFLGSLITALWPAAAVH